MLEKLDILIAHSDPKLRDEIVDKSQLMLYAAELNIETVNTAQEAMVRLHQVGGSDFDAIIMDGELGGMSGPQLAQALRNNKYLREIPIVMCSGDANFERAKKTALDSGVTVVLPNIHTVEQLENAYKEILPPGAFDQPTGTDTKAFKPELNDHNTDHTPRPEPL